MFKLNYITSLFLFSFLYLISPVSPPIFCIQISLKLVYFFQFVLFYTDRQTDTHMQPAESIFVIYMYEFWLIFVLDKQRGSSPLGKAISPHQPLVTCCSSLGGRTP